VSVNAYAVVDNITYPLLFKYSNHAHDYSQVMYIKRARISGGNSARAKEWKFQIELVLADSLYGEMWFTNYNA